MSSDLLGFSPNIDTVRTPFNAPAIKVNLFTDAVVCEQGLDNLTQDSPADATMSAVIQVLFRAKHSEV